MSTPDPHTATASPSGAPTWAQEDADAMFASVVWFDTKAPAELRKRYEGMYVAVLGEEVIDADPDRNALGRRLDARGAELPNRVAIKYVYTPDDVLNFGSRVGSWPASGST